MVSTSLVFIDEKSRAARFSEHWKISREFFRIIKWIGKMILDLKTFFYEKSTISAATTIIER